MTAIAFKLIQSNHRWLPYIAGVSAFNREKPHSKSIVQYTNNRIHVQQKLIGRPE
jgi:hypothetical protein